MSLILDALRKMEEDRRSRRSASGDLRPEVLRYRAAVREPQSRPYLMVAVALVLLAAGIGAGLLLRGRGGESPQANLVAAPAAPPEPAALPAVVPAVVPAQPVAPVPAASIPALPSPSASSTPAVIPAAPPAPVAPVAMQAPLAQGGVVAGSPSARRRKAAPQALPAAPQQQAQHTAAAEELPTLPEIRISGIAWQDERGLRRAVLNGSLVGEGAEVAGARVVEIRENKVRMSRDGQLFDVPFSPQQSR